MTEITVLAVGLKMPAWVNEAVAEYAKRLGQTFKFQLKEIRPERRSDTVSAKQCMALEAARITEALPPNTRLVVLDEKGRAYTSNAFAERLAWYKAEGLKLCFVIGGADGIDAALKQQAHEMIKLSDMILPHALARVLLLEQIYRAESILSGHPYHRE